VPLPVVCQFEQFYVHWCQFHGRLLLYIAVAPKGLMLLDASDKFSTQTLLPFRALNWMGRLIRKDGTSDIG
jgi:hypothetical protein